MAARRPDSPRTDLSELLRMSFASQMQDLAFARPGIVDAYHAPSGRAAVRPAPNLRLSDGQSIAIPPLVNVPVIMTGGGGYGVRVTLRRHDPVMLLFSDRTLEQFKREYAPYDHAGPLGLTLSDAVAIPVFAGALPQGVPEDGLSVHGPFGDPALILSEESVRIRAGEVELIVEPTGIRTVNASLGGTRTEIGRCVIESVQQWSAFRAIGPDGNTITQNLGVGDIDPAVPHAIYPTAATGPGSPGSGILVERPSSPTVSDSNYENQFANTAYAIGSVRGRTLFWGRTNGDVTRADRTSAGGRLLGSWQVGGTLHLYRLG